MKEGHDRFIAHLAIVSLSINLNIREIAVVLALVIQLIVYETVIETHLKVGREAIVLPVNEPICNDLALNPWYPCKWVLR